MNYLTLSGLLCVSLIGLFLVTVRLPAKFWANISSNDQWSSPNALDAVNKNSNPVGDRVIFKDDAPPDDAHTPDNRGEEMNRDGWG